MLFRSTVEQTAALRQLLVDQGRDPSSFPVEFTLMYGLGESRWASAVEGARDAGVDFVTINAMSTTAAWTGMEAPGFRTVTEHIGALERFIQVVGG